MNGLIPDNTSADGSPASIAGVGLALSSYPVAVERSFVARAQAAGRTLATLRFFWNAPRPFFDYVAPWAVVASLPFAPEIVLPTVQYCQDVYPQVTGEYCFRCSFNLTFPHEGDAGPGWTSPYHFGINLGPVVLMCENYRSGLL